MIFSFISFFEKISLSKMNIAKCEAVGLYFLPMFYKKDARLMQVKCIIGKT